jgi:aminopeptidase N
MVAFRDKHANELGSGTRAVDQAIESIEININWMKTHEKTVVDWLKAEVAQQQSG